MSKLFSKVITAGLIVGTLDILSAFVYVFIKTGNFVPLSILKFVASGVFGKDASSDGSIMALSGLLIHYLIAFAFTSFFFWLFPKIKALSKNKIVTGVIYGVFIWTVMNLVIVPLSNVPNRPFNLINAIINCGILIICIGIPLSLMASSFFKEASNVNFAEGANVQ